MQLAHATEFNREQLDLIKQTVAAGTSDLEFAMFMEVSRTLGLNPLQKQIHAVMRWDSRTKKEKMVIQTGIDGYRLIAARTGAHLGTTDPVYGPANKQGFPEWAQVTTRRLVQGHIAEFPATAFWEEYVQTTKDGGPNSMWKGRPKGQLGKCAEALSLRKAFPAELSGVYSDIEMQQADSEQHTQPPQNRTADVTREVAQAAGVEPQQVVPARSPALIAWEEKIGKVGARLTELGLRDQAVMVMRQHPHWKTDLSDAQAVYEGMKQIGEQHAAQQQAVLAPEAQPNQAAQPLDIDEPVEAEVVGAITAAQRGTLMAHVKRTGITDDSGPRSRFYHWFLPAEVPEVTRTNDLTEAQAGSLIAALGNLDNDAAQQTGAEFNALDLPF